MTRINLHFRIRCDTVTVNKNDDVTHDPLGEGKTGASRIKPHLSQKRRGAGLIPLGPAHTHWGGLLLNMASGAA